MNIVASGKSMFVRIDVPKTPEEQKDKIQRGLEAGECLLDWYQFDT